MITITEEPIAPIIDSDAVQAQKSASEPRQEQDDTCVYSRGINSPVSDRYIGISSYNISPVDQTPFMLSISHNMGSCMIHFTQDEAKAMRDALTEAIKAWEAVTGAL